MEGDHYTDIYRECMRNHAASLGSYATDGCGEFTLDDTQPGGALTCAACGCHRNFHRKVSRQLVGAGDVAAAAVPAAANSVEMVDYSGGAGGRQESSSGKKRFRTKFTEEQKEKMLEFAEKLGWRLQRKLDHGGHGNGDLEDEDEIERFCRGVGISRKVFKVWMHNHKNSPSPADSVGPATCTSKK